MFDEYYERYVELYPDFVQNVNDKYVYGTSATHIYIMEKTPNTILENNINYPYGTASVLKIVLIFDKLMPQNTLIKKNIFPKNKKYFTNLRHAFYDKNNVGGNIENNYTGECIRWYAEDIKKAEQEYIDGKKNGVEKIYHISGNIEGIHHYKNGIKCGKFTTYHNSGNIFCERYYHNDMKCGLFTQYYDSGSIKMTGSYANDKMDSLWMEFHKNGVKESEGDYMDGKQTGIWINFYDDGTKKSEGVYTDGNRSGDWMDFIMEQNSDENYYLYATYDNGELNGLRYGFYSNGNKRSKEMFVNGVNVGKNIRWYFTGNISHNIKYTVDGYIFTKWYENGQVCSHKQVIDHETHREYFKWYENGNLKSIETYINGEQCGEWIYYNDDGTISKKCEFIDGEEVTIYDKLMILLNANNFFDMKQMFKNSTTVKDTCFICKDIQEPIINLKCNDKFDHYCCVKCLCEWYKNNDPICLVCMKRFVLTDTYFCE